jgi:acyl carrier protein
VNDNDMIHEKVLAIAKRRIPALLVVSDAQELRKDLGFDSLDLAELASTLEGVFGAPIFDDVPVGAIVTVGELCEFCAKARPAS